LLQDWLQTTHKGVNAQCVEFDTIRGPDTFNNEFCFDAHSGAQIYVRSANMELENSAFYDFVGAKYPGHMQQYRNGTLVLDVQLTRRVLADGLSRICSPRRRQPTLGCAARRIVAPLASRCHSRQQGMAERLRRSLFMP
jgi:hypothetical protein